MKFLFRLIPWIAFLPAGLFGWGATGHQIIARAALASLPEDFPAWARAGEGADQIVFLVNEPDHWRSSRDETFLHSATPEHHFDLEEIADAGMDLDALSPFRYEFAVQFAAARAAHPDNFEPIDPKYNADHTQGFPGFLPWTIAEDYGKLQITFSELKVYQKLGTPEEVAGVRASALDIMGMMAHFVGDGSQPLHVSKYFHGWTGPNPRGFVNRPGWHAWIDSGFIDKAGIGPAEVLAQIRPAAPLDTAPRADGRDPVFVAAVAYLADTNRLVVPLYQLEKDGPLRQNGPPTPEGRAFIDAQLLRAGQMLGDLWLTAWRRAGPDPYLRSELIKRRAAAGMAAP